jgi:hypothetical protein
MTLNNTNPQKTQAQGTGVSTDPDLVTLSEAAGYVQELKDAVLLSFDVTPTVSGPLAFQYVFGSEEYPVFAPSPGEGPAGVLPCKQSNRSLNYCSAGLRAIAGWPVGWGGAHAETQAPCAVGGQQLPSQRCS